MDVSYPYFRADSFLGSLYIQDTGLYNVQIISEKILPKESKKDLENSKFLSVFLKPATR
jgi:phenolic acid decarboxylase